MLAKIAVAATLAFTTVQGSKPDYTNQIEKPDWFSPIDLKDLDVDSLVRDEIDEYLTLTRDAYNEYKLRFDKNYRYRA